MTVQEKWRRDLLQEHSRVKNNMVPKGPKTKKKVFRSEMLRPIFQYIKIVMGGAQS